MKRILGLVICLVITFGCFFSCVLPVKAENYTKYPTRIINVVYDDSGSMIEDTRDLPVDTWCQAKYSMEVFAAMLSENDTMNVYAMSEYDRGATLVLKGNQGTTQNVEKVHEMLTNAGGTPFNAVRRAYSDLVVASADEKWLVVLTDGAFSGIDDIDDYFAKKKSDIKVMFLAMGSEADTIREDVANNIFCEKAETSKQILNKITDICTRIFNSNKLSVNMNTKQFSFDVPMSELVVFAQGANVKINGITASGGKGLSAAGVPVAVRYSEKATTNTGFKNIKVDRNLVGSVQTFKGDFDAGNYTVDVAGAETIEIYYKPNVSIAAYLTDMKGHRIESMDALEEGDYTISFGLVRSGTTESVPESKLLGDIAYSAYVTINGTEDNCEYRSGDKVTLVEGTFRVDAKAEYLKYNTVTTQLTYNVYRNKELTLEVVENPKYVLEGEGISNNDMPIIVKATLEGNELSSEQWDYIDALGIRMTDNADTAFLFKTEKDLTVGYFKVYPQVNTSAISVEKEYSDIGLCYNVRTMYGDETWSGETEGIFNLADKRFKELELAVVNNPTYHIKGDNFADADKPVVLKATIEGREFAEDEWKNLNELDIVQSGSEDERVEFVSEKTSTPGIFNIYPKLVKDETTSGEYGNIDISLSTSGTYGVESWEGTTTDTIKIEDQRSWLAKNLDKVIKIGILLLLLLLILGYIPPFKKYLPKKLKSKPKIDCMPNVPGKRPWDAHGRFTKNRISTLVPYKAETGAIKFLTGDVTGVPVMRVKAAGSNRMEISNTVAYAGKENLTFNGKPVKAGTKKKLKVSAGVVIRYSTKDTDYKCSPNK